MNAVLNAAHIDHFQAMPSADGLASPGGFRLVPPWGRPYSAIT